MKPFEALARRRVVVWLCFGALAVGGLLSWSQLPVGLFPRTRFPRVVVSASAGDRPAERMAIEVTQPIEEAVRGVPGVRRVRSTSSRGSADVSVDFAWGTDMVAATLQIESAIARVASALPPGFAFEARRMDPTVFPVLGLSLTSASGATDPVALRDLALYTLRPPIAAIDGVARVEAVGGASEELQVLVDPDRLAALQLSFEDVARAVSAANVLRAVGRIEDDEKLYLALADTEVRSPAELGAVVLRRSSAGAGAVRVRDVARVVRATAPQWTRVTADGADAVLVNVFQHPDGDTVAIAAELARRVDALRPRLPRDVRIQTWYDQGELIDASTASARDAIALGTLLAVGVLVLFLRSWRAALVAALAAPVVLAATTLALGAMHATLNLMTLGGMAAAVGLILDDAIVTIEHVIRRLRERSSTLVAAAEIALPLTGSSLASMAIFVPLGFLSGVTGAFFKPLAFTMAIALGISWAFALLAVPLLADSVLRRADAEKSDAGPRWTRFARRYERLLGVVVARPQRVALPVLVVLALGAVAWMRLGSGFLPAIDEGGFVLDYVAPPGTSLRETDRQVREVERILRETPEVATWSRRTGLALGGFVTEANEGDFFVRLHDFPRRPIGEVIDDVRARVEAQVPALEVELPQLLEDLIGDLTAVPQPVEVELFGEDRAALRDDARRVAAALAHVPGVVDVKSGVVLAGDALHVRVARDRAGALGLDSESVAAPLALALGGEVVGSVQRGEKMVGIRVWTTPEARSRVTALRSLRLAAPGGAAHTLGSVADLSRVEGQAQITRENLATLVPVTARISGRDLGSVMSDVRAAVAGVPLSLGARVEFGGQYREQQSAFRNLAVVVGAALALTFALLLALFGRWSLAVAMLAVIFVAAAGVFIGLFVTGRELDVSALMGLTMVVGISAESAVFLVSELALELRVAEPRVAIASAARARLRPILMTALAAMLALAPIALGIGRGAAMLQPLAIVFGLAFTVPAVLVMLPSLLALFLRRDERARVAPKPHPIRRAI